MVGPISQLKARFVLQDNPGLNLFLKEWLRDAVQLALNRSLQLED